MREIEFRGKRSSDGTWIYGGFYRDDNSLFIREFGHKSGYSVVPETVCQYTGQLDKRGVKIYEGDIINELWSNQNSFIIFACGRFMSSRDLSPDNICTGVTRWNECVVIGNIHDSHTPCHKIDIFKNIHFGANADPFYKQLNLNEEQTRVYQDFYQNLFVGRMTGLVSHGEYNQILQRLFEKLINLKKVVV